MPHVVATRAELAGYGPQIKTLIRAIGVPDTMTLLDRRGGTVIRIPKRGGGILAGMLTLLQIRALADAFGPGALVELPMPDKLLARIRNQAIFTAHHVQGISLSTLALQYRLTVSQIKKILKKMGAPPKTGPQADLFQPSDLETAEEGV